MQGMTVLDLGQVYGGPYCSHLLGHLGARVIKIESPAGGEPLRGRPGDDAAVQPVGFQLLNGGKESVTLDLKTSEGHRLFLKLASRADVIVENFAPGTTAALGVDYETISALNPRIVYASLKAYAQDSPNRDLRGMDLTVQASSGVMSVNGFPDGPPVRCGPSLVDFLGGAHLTVGVLAALLERARTGRGQLVDVALQDSVIPSLSSNIAGWLTNPGAVPERTGNRHGGMRESPYNTYPTTDGWVAILCITGPQWRGLAGIIGREDLREDPSLASAPGRVARMYEIDDAVGAWTSSHTAAEVIDALQSAGVPVSQLKTIEQLVADETTRTEPILQRVGGDGERPTYTFGSPVRLANHPVRLAGAVPALGQHTTEVLAEIEDVDRAGDRTEEGHGSR